MFRAARHETGNGSGAGVEVIDQIRRLQFGEVARHLVEFVSLLRVGLIETLRSDFEAKSFHFFDDERCAVVGVDGQVADGVVALEVVHPKQRGDFGEGGVNVVQEFACLSFFLRIANGELNQQHDFSRGRSSQHEVAQKSGGGAEVEERETVGQGVVTDAVSDAVVETVHQRAGLDVKDFVKRARNVEAQSVHVVKLHAGAHLLFRQPSLVGEAELKFVAIVGLTNAAKNRADFRQFHLGNALQVVSDLLLLVVQLLFVGQTLPFAAATHAKVGTKGLNTLGRLAVETNDFRLGITVLLATHLQINHIAGHGVGHKNHEVVHASQCFAFSRDAGDFNVF